MAGLFLSNRKNGQQEAIAIHIFLGLGNNY